MYRYEFVPDIRKTRYLDQVWEILCECDKDFVPPLSSRNGTGQKNFSSISNGSGRDGEKTGESKPTEYFNKMIQQHFILALDENNDVAGFLSFSIDNPILEDITRNIYMSTACIRKKDRGKRISGEFYEYVEYKLPEEFKRDKILTRTWSTNEKQVHIFTKRGYKPVKVLPNDRGPGIDTIYFLKEL